MQTTTENTERRFSDEDRAFLQAFEAGGIAPADFHHRDHIRAAWAMLQVVPVLDALPRFCAALRRFAARAGNPGIYHETITWAYLLLIHERLARGDQTLSFAEFAARNADLLAWKPSILDTYYPAEVLASDLARQVFVMPRNPNGFPASPAGSSAGAPARS